jgi:hypothetical protein
MQVLLVGEVKTTAFTHFYFLYIFLPFVTHSRVHMVQRFVLKGCGCYIMESLPLLGLLVSPVLFFGHFIVSHIISLFPLSPFLPLLCIKTVAISPFFVFLFLLSHSSFFSQYFCYIILSCYRVWKRHSAH